MELEQATLSQYFTTRRKGLEGVHPAKRRKVEAFEELATEKVLRRSTRSKTRAKTASISQTKASRSGRGTNSASKKSVNEESLKSVPKVVSEPTSLLDDHEFAEALFGKLEAANRKRKMASRGRMEEVYETSIKASSKEDNGQETKNGEIDSTKMNDSGRRRAKGVKPFRKESSYSKQETSEFEDRRTSSSELDSATASTQEITGQPVEKNVMSPSKTSPVVRRIAGGVGANPWIAEQARAVLSRGRIAVNLSEKAKNENRVKTRGAADEKNGEPDTVASKSMNKEQDDLAKARKLIKTMRSLEKNASKPARQSTEDTTPRLHEVASAKTKNTKSVTTSGKEIPAYERFHALAQPTATDVSTTDLPLPYKYKMLAEMFRCTDTVLNLLGQRKENCTFGKLRDAVQQMSRKRFEKKHLAQMKTVNPSAFDFHQDGCLGKSSEFELTVQFGKVGEVHNKLTLTAAEMLARKDGFHKNLLQFTKKHHQDFLSNLNPSVSVDNDKIVRWHPKFRLDDVPDIEEASLPLPPVVKTYSSAHDVLEKARGMIAPRVEKALRNVANGNNGNEPDLSGKEKKLTENKETAKKAEDMQNKNNTKQKPALKGISQDLLNKIRQKEARKIEETMMRDPLVDKKLAMRERLPDLCRILKTYFSSERKAAIPLEDATVKLAESYKSSLSAVQVEEHLKLASQLVPEWVSILTVRKCSYVKINKTADVNNVINKLVKTEIN